MADLSFEDYLLKEDLTYLSKPLKITYECNLGDKVFYNISMNNHYIAPTGEISKEQILSASYQRAVTAWLTPKSAILTYTWDDVDFTSDNWKNESISTKWTFAKGLTFNNIMTYPTKIAFRTDSGYSNSSQEYTGIDYSNLAAVPTVNLLHMLSWDVIGLEEIVSFLSRHMESYTEPGEFVKIGTITDIRTKLGFCSCKSSSFFENGQFEAAFVGIGRWKGCVGVWIEYRCLGKLECFNTKENRNAISQKGTSCYFGKVLIDLSTGNLLKGDMVELVSGVITNKESKWVPQQKRRFIFLERV